VLAPEGSPMPSLADPTHITNVSHASRFAAPITIAIAVDAR
jgi:hypothetical protein